MTRSANMHTLQEIEQMVEGYFNCELTEQQEQELKQELASTRLSSSIIDEARATMGFMSVGMEAERRRQMDNRRQARRKWVAVAASIAIVAVVGGGLLTLQNRQRLTSSDLCVAWVGGNEVTGDDDVMRLVHSDLRSFSDASSPASQNISQQLVEMKSALERD